MRSRLTHGNFHGVSLGYTDGNGYGRPIDTGWGGGKCYGNSAGGGGGYGRGRGNVTGYGGSGYGCGRRRLDAGSYRSGDGDNHIQYSPIFIHPFTSDDLRTLVRLTLLNELVEGAA